MNLLLVSCVVPNTRLFVARVNSRDRFDDTKKSIEKWGERASDFNTLYLLEVISTNASQTIYEELKVVCEKSGFKFVPIIFSRRDSELVAQRGTGLSEIIVIDEFFRKADGIGEDDLFLKVSARYFPDSYVQFRKNFLLHEQPDILAVLSNYFRKTYTVYFAFKKSWFKRHYRFFMWYIDDRFKRYMESAFFYKSAYNHLAFTTRVLGGWESHRIISGTRNTRVSFLKRLLTRIFYTYF